MPLSRASVSMRETIERGMSYDPVQLSAAYIEKERYRGELTMLDGKGEGGGRSYDDDSGGSFTSKAGGKRVAEGPRESFNADLDDEIPF